MTESAALLAEARVGTTLAGGTWRLDRLIGVGGMAAVYHAVRRDGAHAAAKVLHREAAVNDEARARFVREGQVANAIPHPGVVRIFSAGSTDDGSAFLLMELLDGSSTEALAEARPQGKLTVREVVDIAEQTLSVLDAAHAQGVFHRDIKPENLFLTRGGALKVLDFGLATFSRAMRSENVRYTHDGRSMGTPAFMSPEQALGHWDKVDARSDIFAVGATLFTLLTGRLPHEGDTVQEMMLAAMTKTAPPVSSIEPSVPAPLAQAIDKALSFSKENRFSDAKSMRAAILASGGYRVAGRTAAVVARPPPRRTMLLVALGAILIGLVGVVGVAWTLTRRVQAENVTPIAIATAEVSAPAPEVSVSAPVATDPTTSTSASASPSASASAEKTKKPRTGTGKAGTKGKDPFAKWK